MRTNRTKSHQNSFHSSPSLFDSILNFYLTGTFHVPIHVCKWQFKIEMDFWQIPRDIVALCCQKRLLAKKRSNSEK